MLSSYLRLIHITLITLIILFWQSFLGFRQDFRSSILLSEVVCEIQAVWSDYLGLVQKTAYRMKVK